MSVHRNRVIAFAVFVAFLAFPNARAQQDRNTVPGGEVPGALQPLACSYERHSDEVLCNTNVNQETTFNFAQAIQLPDNILLNPGQYSFVLVESQTNRNLVQIFNADHHLIATLPTAPTERVRTVERTTLRLAEGSGKAPDVLLTWFYPGYATGHEFLFTARERKALSERRVVTVSVPEGAKTLSFSSKTY